MTTHAASDRFSLALEEAQLEALQALRTALQHASDPETLNPREARLLATAILELKPLPRPTAIPPAAAHPAPPSSPVPAPSRPAPRPNPVTAPLPHPIAQPSPPPPDHDHDEFSTLADLLALLNTPSLPIGSNIDPTTLALATHAPRGP